DCQGATQRFTRTLKRAASTPHGSHIVFVINNLLEGFQTEPVRWRFITMRLAQILSGFQSARHRLSFCLGIYPNSGRLLAEQENVCARSRPGWFLELRRPNEQQV